MINATEQLQRMMIQSDLEAAYEAIGAGQYRAALMVLNGAEEKLKMILEAADAGKKAKAAADAGKKAKAAEGKKQLTFDIQST